MVSQWLPGESINQFRIFLGIVCLVFFCDQLMDCTASSVGRLVSALDRGHQGHQEHSEQINLGD